MITLPDRYRDALPLLAAGATLALWSSAFAGMSYGLRVFTPAELALLRFGIASLLFALPVAAGAIRLPPRQDWPAIALLGFLGITVYQLALGYAMSRIAAGAAAVVIALVPGVTAALAAWRLGERLGARTMAGLAVAFAGVVLVALGSRHGAAFEPMALLVLVSVFATSIYFVWQKPLLARTTPVAFTVASVFAGTLGLLPFGSGLVAKLPLVPPAQVAVAVYLGIGPTVLGYLCWNWALSRAPAAKVTSFLYVQPLLASLVAWAWLGQTLTPLAIAGGVLAIGGVVLAVRGPRAVAVARPLAGVVPAPASALPACCRS